MNISVIGTGYVGLITGTCLADLGLNVICADKDPEKIQDLAKFQAPVYEPGIETMLKKSCREKKLTFTTKIEDAVLNSEAIFISVGTPGLNDGNADLSQIYSVAGEIAGYMEHYTLIIIKSTVPPGTCRKIKEIIRNILYHRNKTIDFDIASNPEFLREGTAVHDFMHPDRIVFGVENAKAANIIRDIYSSKIFRKVKFIETTLETSEMIKYASNAFLAAKISFINEIADICELCGADVKVAAEAMGLDKRIGKQFIKPGPGFGGSCFPKDVKALLRLSRDLGFEPNIINGILKTNDFQILHSINLIKAVTENIEGKTFSVLGAAFKANTDDVRESPSINIIKELLKAGGSVRIYDPKAMDNMKILHPDLEVTYCDSEYSACEGCDCIILATEWKQFEKLDFEKLSGIVKAPVLVDLRNLFDPEKVKDFGFIYKGTGIR